MNLGELRPGESRSLSVRGIAVGQILKLQYLQSPEEPATGLRLEPSADVLFREIDHEREDMENGYIRHIIRFRVERIGL